VYALNCDQWLVIQWQSLLGNDNRECDIELFKVWIGLSSVLHPRQHSIGYMGDGFYRLDPTNSIKVLKEHIIHRQNHTYNNQTINTKHSKSPSLH